MAQDLTKQDSDLIPQNEEVYGFEETRPEDIVIPRAKVINALTPERVDGEAE